jgi:acetylornithine deacetylase/succinyl-diaminopimelate desuccinylase-like protein
LFFFLLPSLARAAGPDWPQFEKRALEFLQQYLRIRSINPPANTTETAALIRAELEANGLTPKLYESGPNGQTNLVVRLKGRDASKKPLLLLNHMDGRPGGREGMESRPVRRHHPRWSHLGPRSTRH